MRANYWSQTTSFSSSILKVRYVYWDQASLFVFSKPTEYLWCDGYKEKEKPITISSLITSASIQQPSLLSSSKGLENIMIQRNHCWIKTLKENFLFICLSRPPPTPCWIITDLTRFRPWWQNMSSSGTEIYPPFKLRRSNDFDWSQVNKYFPGNSKIRLRG